MHIIQINSDLHSRGGGKASRWVYLLLFSFISHWVEVGIKRRLSHSFSQDYTVLSHFDWNSQIASTLWGRARFILPFSRRHRTNGLGRDTQIRNKLQVLLYALQVTSQSNIITRRWGMSYRFSRRMMNTMHSTIGYVMLGT